MNLISFKLKVGQWFTPSACVQLFSRAVSQSISPLLSPFRVHLCSDGRLFVPQLDRLSGNWTRQIILFVALRLGTSNVNEVEKDYEISIIFPPSISDLLSSRSAFPVSAQLSGHWWWKERSLTLFYWALSSGNSKSLIELINFKIVRLDISFLFILNEII